VCPQECAGTNDVARMKVMKYAVVVVLLALLGAGVWWWRGRTAQNGGPVYATTIVRRGEINVTVNASGTINPVATVIVGSQVSGRIQDLHADYNSVVTSGQVVAQLEESPFIVRVRQSAATLAKAKANVRLVKATLERQKTLSQQKVTSSAELDDAQAKFDQAVADEMQAQALLDSANIDLQHATIYSPVDGTVLTRSVDVGQTVAASFQAPVLFTIAADLTKMQIEAKVDEADVGQVAVGQTVTFTVEAYRGQIFTGTVQQIRNSPVIVQNVVSYDTIISVNNDELKLRPGMTADTTVMVSNRADVLVVPNAALRMKLPNTVVARNDAGAAQAGTGRVASAMQPSVYVLRNGAPHAAPVQTGVADDNRTEITHGLAEGDAVITGYATASAGTRATVNPFAGPQSGGRGPR